MAGISVDAVDAAALADWWARHTGGTVQTEAGGLAHVVTGPGTPPLGFQEVESPTPGKNRWHLDLVVDDLPAAVLALTTDGARLLAEHDLAEAGHPEVAWMVLADPEGNQFCVAQRTAD